MKYITFAVMLSILSFNTFAGENPDKPCHYCIPCHKEVCKGTQVDANRGGRKDIREAKRAARKAKRAAGKNA